MSEQTPNLDLPYIMAGQAQKHVTHNEAIRTLDAVVQISVASRTTVEPPANPADGERLIVPVGATGAFAGQDHALAAFQDEGWIFRAPQAGWLAWVEDENRLVAFDGATWAVASSDGTGADQLGINATADATNRLTVKSDGVLLTHDDVTPGNGDMRQSLNKAAPGNTTSVLFQSAYSGRAEMGLAGQDDFSIKVSADGGTWTEALRVDGASGTVTLPHTPGFATGLPAGGAGGEVLTKTGPGATDAAWQQAPAQPSVDAQTRHLYENDLGTLPRRAAKASLNAGATRQADGTWLAPIGTSCSFDLPVPAPSEDLHVDLPMVAGEPVTATIDQIENGSTLPNGQLSLVRERNRMVLRPITALPEADTFRVRIDNVTGTQPVRFIAPGLGHGEPMTAPQDEPVVSLSNLTADRANSARNLITLDNITSLSGPAPQRTGDDLVLPQNGICRLAMLLEDLHEIGEPWTLVFHASTPLRQASVTATDNQGTTVLNTHWHDLDHGWQMLSGEIAATAPSATLHLELDNSTGGDVNTADCTLSRFWLGRQTTSPPAQITLPGVVHDTLAHHGAFTIHVDETGRDGASGTTADPVATIEEALDLGAGTILLKRGQTHRSGGISLKKNLTLAPWGGALAPTDESAPRLLFSMALDETSLTALSSGVFFFPVGENPGGVWEVNGTNNTRMGVTPPDNGHVIMADSEQTVGDNAGSWWHGVGSQGTGLYLHPYDGTVVGKSFEVPTAQTGITSNDAAHLTLTGLRLGFAAHHLVDMGHGVLTTSHCHFDGTGTGHGLHATGHVIWNDSASCFEDAFASGAASDSGCYALCNGTRFAQNGRHGVEFSGDQNRLCLLAIEAVENGGDGIVIAGTGKARIDGATAVQNGDEGLRATLSGVGETLTLTLTQCTSQSTRALTDNPPRLVANVNDHKGPLTLGCMGQVNGLTVTGDDQTTGLSIATGISTVTGARLAGLATGVTLTSGILTLTDSAITRCALGIDKIGGDFTTDPARPVNLHANTVDSQGVDQAQLDGTVDIPVL
ncbi:MAG: DUF2793 domain-containing protein [Pseudomonadota bacterium]